MDGLTFVRADVLPTRKCPVAPASRIAISFLEFVAGGPKMVVSTDNFELLVLTAVLGFPPFHS